MTDELAMLPLAPNQDVGIDPGTKTVLTTSDGEKFERENLTRKYEEKLAKAQRHRKKRRAKSLHAKIKNKRQDWNHKASLAMWAEWTKWVEYKRVGLSELWSDP